MFHAVSVTSNVDQALALLYRYSHLATGMRQDGLETALTAVVEERSALADDRALFAIGRLKLLSLVTIQNALVQVHDWRIFPTRNSLPRPGAGGMPTEFSAADEMNRHRSLKI
jgi:hypothetical protein